MLKGFAEHGVHFLKHASSQSHGVCPFCGKDKFFVNPLSFLWDCKTCQVSGNFEQFLEAASVFYQQYFEGEPAATLSANRGLDVATLKAWGLGYNPVDKIYTVPLNGTPERKTTNIYRYVIGQKCMSTSGGKLCLLAPQGDLPETDTVWLGEGPWDAMTIWEALNGSERVYAIPGAGNFPSRYVGQLDGKQANLLPDNDCVNSKTGTRAGYTGAIRTGRMLSGHASKVKYLHWPKAAANKDTECDVRKHYINSGRNKEELLSFLRANLRDTEPASGVVVTTLKKIVKAPVPAKVEPITTQEVVAIYKKWLYLTDIRVLDIVFGSVFANRIGMDPLWIFFVAPPGGTKTELLMPLSDAPGIVSTTSVTPASLISGANSKVGGGDPSLIPKLNGKILIIKDFTTILNCNPTARDEIFGILRDAYDGKTEKYFGTGVHRKYISKFGIMAGVTPAIEGYSSSSSVLGERFIKAYIRMKGKVDVGRESIIQAIKNSGQEDAMRLELSTAATRVLDKQIPGLPVVPEGIADKILGISQLVAALRGVVSRDRFSGTINFKPCSEIGTRLSKQFTALARGIAVYRNLPEVNLDILEIVAQVARDTTPDRIECIVRHMYLNPDKATSQEVSDWCGLPRITVEFVLEDLFMLNVIQKDRAGLGTFKTVYSLTSNTRDMIQYCRFYYKIKKVTQ